MEKNHPRLVKIIKKQATMGIDSKRAERFLRENDEPKLTCWIESKKG